MPGYTAPVLQAVIACIEQRFAEVFELASSAVASPCSAWESGTLDRRRALLKGAFEERLVYSRNEGFGTPKTFIIFSMLAQLCSPIAEIGGGDGIRTHDRALDPITV